MHRGCYGYRRLHDELLDEGYSVKYCWLAAYLYQDYNMELFFIDLIEWTKKYNRHYEFDYMIYLLADAFELDLDDEDQIEEAAEKFEAAISSGRIPTLEELK